MKNTILVLAFALSSSALTADSPKRLFIDPATRWESIHDKTGTGAKAEITLDILKACPSAVQIVDSRETADYSALIDRTGMSAGSVVISSGGVVVNTFKPGHSATLTKVAASLCRFIAFGVTK